MVVKKQTYGGARLAGNPTNFYVGDKLPMPRKFDALATRKIAFLCGRRAGFSAGIVKGLAEGTKQAVAHAVARSKIVKALHKTHTAKVKWIKKTEITPDIPQRHLQAIAYHLGIHGYQRSKAQLYPDVMGHHWVRIKAKKALLNK